MNFRTLFMLNIRTLVKSRVAMAILGMLLVVFSVQAWRWWLQIDLRRGIEHAQVERVRNALDRGADPNWKYSPHKYDRPTPLVLACFSGNLEIIKLLVESGADPFVTFPTSRNLLWVVLGGGGGPSQIECMEYLIDQGVDPNGKDREGRTALHRASMSGYSDALKTLIAKGGNVNVQNREGETPLHYACSSVMKTRNKKDVVTILLEAGADITLKSHDGQTALDWAVENKIPDVVDLIRSKANKEAGQIK